MKIGFLFGGLSFIAVTWAYFFVPETKDRTLEELDEMFLKKLPVEQFTSYIPDSLPRQEKPGVEDGKYGKEGTVQMVEHAV